MKALVLGGGGVKGAFELGVLKHLLCNLGEEYDIITGISVGALNGAFLAQYPKGQEQQAWQDLDKLWMDIKGNRSIYRPWYYGLLWKLPLLWKSSIYNSQPLQTLVRSGLNADRLKKSGKILRVGAVSYTSGVYKEWTEKDDDIHDGVIASSAFPGFLTPPVIDGELWTDGGVQNVVPLDSAIKLGATEIDIIATSPLKPTTLNDLSPNVLTIAKKTVDLMGDEIVREDLRALERTNRRVSRGLERKKRFIKYRLFVPEQSLIGDSLNFDPKGIRRMKDIGYLKAWAVTNVS